MKKAAVFVLFVLILPIVLAKDVPIGRVSEGEVASGGITYYALAGSDVIASIDSIGVTYHHEDRMNSVVLTSGGSVKRSKTLPFGKELGGGGIKFTFTGKEADSSGLYYYGARYYDYTLGRFLSADPIMDESTYGYVDNNPLKFIDPLGEAKVVHIAVADPGSQIAMRKSVEEVGGEFYGYGSDVEEFPEGVHSIVISGHHFPSGDTIWRTENGQRVDFRYSDIPRSESARVVVLSGCRTILPPANQNAWPEKKIEMLTHQLPNLQVILGYWGGAPLHDEDIAYLQGKILGLTEEIEDPVEFGRTVLREVRDDLRRKGPYTMAFYAKVGGEWRFYSLTDYKEGSDVLLRDEEPPETQGDDF